MAFWIIEAYDTSKSTGSTWTITNEQPRTNMKHKPLDDGWLGDTNNHAKHAHGKYDTIGQARVVLRDIIEDKKMVVIKDIPNFFSGYTPHDYRQLFSKRPSELWRYDGSADYIVQAWREHIAEQGKPGDDDYIAESNEHYIAYINVTSMNIAKVEDYRGYIDYHYFSWEHDDKKALIHQEADGIFKGVEDNLWEHVQKNGIPV